MIIINKQKELKYIVLNGIHYSANKIKRLDIDGIDVSITYESELNEIKGTVYNLEYVFDNTVYEK